MSSRQPLLPCLPFARHGGGPRPALVGRNSHSTSTSSTGQSSRDDGGRGFALGTCRYRPARLLDITSTPDPRSPRSAHPRRWALGRDVFVSASHKGPFVGGDVVELLPSADEGGRTAVAAAKLAKELAGLMVLSR